MMKLAIATAIAALSGTTFAHGGVTSYIINGTKYPGYIWYDPEEGQKDLIQRTWNMNPLSDPASGNITCNNRGVAVPGAYHASVQAGGTIRTSWESTDTGFGWVHTLGPVVAYMAACGDDCTTITDTADLKWFKIAEEGLRAGYAVGSASGWFQGDLFESTITDHWDVVVPTSLKPGRYMIRHEIIMISLNPVQFYPNCAALEVTGGGEAVPTDDYLVQFPGAYSLSDPGIAISGKTQGDTTTKNYTIPGPKVWTGA